MLWLFIVLIFDRLTKLWAIASLKEQAPMEVIPGILELHYAENTGIAFSLFNDMPMLLIWINCLIILGLIAWVIKNKKLDLGFALIIAGGLGNLIDRFFYGYVVDFINPLFIDFAVFNVSDIALNLGVVALLVESFQNKKLSCCSKDGGIAS
ncbi:MAG: signal peptidase II [Cyanobacteria bacterium]|nr:signal peptidase II [Cyanobacteriota bacterium]MDA1020152.1 signal peptidase II [Cyanobacteriota bacterium]